MKFSAAINKLTACIAIFAILLLSLAPSISSALNRNNQAMKFGTEICSAQGSIVKLMQTTNSKIARDMDSHTKTCAYCSLHAAKHMTLTGFAINFVAILQSEKFPQLFYFAPSPLFTWLSSQPRAPPALS
ncbi:DUF2946 domain-containing protein [Undibacterium sp. SXout11W]|uniref:DUF2946 domain-containing protein n=1 Tax=Undibacterium sp. SXout11W TaxID=3413050 RepID=UPI003BF38ADE